MKKLIIIVLSVVWMVLIFPCSNVDAKSVKEQAGESYAKIIQNYLKAYNLAKKDPYNFEDDSVVNLEFVNAVGYSKGVIYRIADYNKDGFPELFIGLRMTNSKGMIYDVYTFDNGNAVRIMDGIGYRGGTCIFCKNNIIKDMWSDSAVHSGVIFHKMPGNMKKLTDVISLEYNSDNNTGEIICTKNVNGKITRISETEYHKLYKKYNKPVKITFYKADSKAVKMIKRGKFTYNKQKKWKIGE